MRNDYKTASRLLTLIDRVDRGRPLRLKSIIEEFEVDIRCAREYRAFVLRHRDMEDYRDGRQRVWQKAAGDDTSIARAAALDFAVQALAELQGTKHHRELEIMAQQARLALEEVDRMQLDRVTTNFQVRTSERSRNPNHGKWTERLLIAQQKRQVCRIQYDGLNGMKGTYEIEPWGIVLHLGQLACMAGKRDLAHGPRPVRRMYLIDGIQKVVVTREKFQVPAARHTDYAEIFRDSFGIFCGMPDEAQDVHLQVRGRHAIAMRQRPVHPTQQVSDGQDGSLNVRLRLVLCPEFVGWVLSMFPDVQVKAPQVLSTKLEHAVALWQTRSEQDR